MNKLIVKSITIVDISEKAANKFSFSDSTNLIVSADNTVGKSSLMKSIYYTLGAKIDTFPKTWNYKQYVFQLEIEINDKPMIIKLYRNQFTVNTLEENFFVSNERDFSELMQRELGIHLELQNRQGKYEVAYMNALLSVFYIDQEKSWANFYKDSVANLGMYKDPRKGVLSFLFGISNSEITDHEQKKNELTSRSKAASSKVDQLREIFDEYIVRAEGALPIPENFEELLNEFESYKHLTNVLARQINEYSRILVKLQTESSVKKKDLAEATKLLQATDERYKKVAYECAYCHSVLTRQQSLTRLELVDNDVEIHFRIHEIETEIDNTSQKMEDTRNKLADLELQFQTYSDLINELKSFKDIDTLVKGKVLQEMENNINIQIIEINNLETQIDSETLTIKELKKQISARKRELESDFDQLKAKVAYTIGDDLDFQNRFMDFKGMTGTGTALNKNYLVYYITYLNMLQKYADVKIPVSVDSFIKNEITDDNQVKMFKALDEYLLSEPGQKFFSVIEANKKLLSYQNYDEILLEKPVLRSDRYGELIKQLIEENAK